jgi:hypothetical protein
MKEYTREQVLSVDDMMRLPDDPTDWLDFCINTLIKDKTITYQSQIGDRLTIEELMGALLSCKKFIRNKYLEENYEDTRIDDENAWNTYVSKKMEPLLKIKI